MIDLLRALTYLAYWVALGALILGILLGAERLSAWFHNYHIKNPAERANATTGLNNDSEVLPLSRTTTMCHYGNDWCRNQFDTSHECPPKPEEKMASPRQGISEKQLQTFQLRCLRDGTPLTPTEHGEVFKEIERLHKQVKDKDQAILLLNELLDTTDIENETLRQQIATVGASRKEAYQEAYQEGWQDCEEHQKSRSDAWPASEAHPLGKEVRPSMPWTSQDPPNDDDRSGRECMHCYGEGHGRLGGQCGACHGRGWQ